MLIRRSTLLVSTAELARLAELSCRSERSCRRVYSGLPVTPRVLKAVQRAAVQLGLPAPPTPRITNAATSSPEH
jgi:hypothetical protein